MTSTTFSPKIFEYFRELKVSCLQGFRQIRGITILYAVLLLVFFPLLLFFISFAMGCMEPGAHRTVLENVLTCENVLNVLTASSLTSLFALIFAFSLCRFMHTRRSTDLFHSLPLKRGPMLLGRFLSGVFSLFLVLLLVWIAVLGVFLFLYRIQQQDLPLQIFTALSSHFLVQFLMGCASMAFSFLINVCCGTIVDALISVLGITVSVPLTIFFCQLYMYGTLPGFVLSSAYQGAEYFFFSPFLSAFYMASSNYTLLWWWILFVPLTMAAALGVYRLRKSEAAETSFAFPLPKILIRFFVTCAGGMIFGVMAQILSDSGFYLWFVIGSFCSHLILEVIYDRGFKGFAKSLIAYGAFAGIACLFFGIVAAGFFGFDTRVPTADTIEWVEYELSDGYETSDNPGVYLYSLPVQDQKKNESTILPFTNDAETIQSIQQAHTAAVQEYSLQQKPYWFHSSSSREFYAFGYNGAYSGNSRVHLRYHLKDGTVLERTYQQEDAERFLKVLKENTKQPLHPYPELYAILDAKALTHVSVSDETDEYGWFDYTGTQRKLTEADAKELLKILQDEAPNPLYNRSQEKEPVFDARLSLMLTLDVSYPLQLTEAYSWNPAFQGKTLYLPSYWEEQIEISVSQTDTPQLYAFLETRHWLPAA